jgi:hypothetical protein
VPIAAGELLEAGGVGGVQRHVDPVQPGLGQGRGEPAQADAVGGEHHARAAGQRGDRADDLGQAPAQQRLAAGEPHVGDAQAVHRDFDEAHDLRRR